MHNYNPKPDSRSKPEVNLGLWSAPKVKRSEFKLLAKLKAFWQTYSFSAKLDYVLLFLLLSLVAISLAVLFSAKGGDWSIVKHQGLRFGLGAIIMLAVTQLPFKKLMDWSVVFYILGLILLVIVLVIGSKAKGAQRWLFLGGLKFQPSELIKLALPMVLARYMHTRASLPPNWYQLSISCILILVPLGLVILQPDLGTGILVASSGFFVLFFAGLPWVYMLVAVVLSLVSAPMLWLGLHSYQKRRILTLLNPESDPLGSGYHIIQSKIAIGSGGLWGKGWLQGTQSQLEFLPERSTDFIFAVLAEEFGLVGVAVLLAVYGLIVARGLYLSYKMPQVFSKLLSASLIMTFFMYVVVNIGMVIGLLPVVGEPLPMLSYGGTSIISLLIGFGLIMAVRK